MEKCRICLNNRKRMQSLFDRVDEGFTFAEMVTLIANVKVLENDGLPKKTCQECTNKIKDVYSFKRQIERSDIELQNSAQIKNIRFTDIKDIKFRIDIKETSNTDAVNHNNIIENFVKNCESSLNYSDTIIKKLAYTDIKEIKNLTMKEFLESIKEDPENEHDIIYETAVDHYSSYNVADNYIDGYFPESDPEYTPSTKYIKKKSSNKSICSRRKNIIAKPVYLSDIRLLHTKVNTSKSKSKVCKKKSKDMCPHCGIMVASLKVHILIHSDEKKFKCEKCAKSFYSQSTLINHAKLHENKVYKCDKCVAIFHTPNYLRTHKSAIHIGDEKKFACETCGKTFKRNAHLKRHCAGVHNMSQKKFTCDQCSMSFLCKSNLNHHMRVHTGERPFKCELCSQPYSYRSDFTRHCLKKHGVFLKGRKVNCLNEETLNQERAVMKDLALRVNGLIKDDKPVSPFGGPHAVRVFNLALKALEARQIGEVRTK